MTDPLPRLEPLTPLPVVPGQVQRALADVRARRRRSAAAVTALSLAVLTAVGLGVSGTARHDSLDVVPTDRLPVESTRQPAPDRGGASAAVLAPGAVAERSGGPAAAPTPSAGVPSILGSPQPQSSTQPAASPRPGYRRRPPVTREVRQTYVDAEQGKGGVRSGGCVAESWCASVTAAVADGSVTMRVVVCRDATAPDSVLWFDTDEEVDLSVRTAGEDSREVWRWSAGQRFRANEHDVAVPSGACAEWTAVWDGVLDSGEDLPAGDYVLAGFSRSAELAGEEPTATVTVP